MPVVNRMAVVTNPDITVRTLIHQKVSPSFPFCPDKDIIRVVTACDKKTDIFDFLDCPLSLLLEQLEGMGRPAITVIIAEEAGE